MPSVLLVFTSCNTNLVGKQTGYYLPEAAHPYYVFTPTCNVDFASPKGSDITVDEYSVKTCTDDESVKFLNDEIVKGKFLAAKKLSEVDVKDYDAVYYVGGHGPVIDLPNDDANIKLASSFYQAGKITAAVCHGPAALLNAVDADGKSIFAGKNFTGFSNSEEQQVQASHEKEFQAVDGIPFSLEDELQKKGGKYSSAEPWAPKVVVDGLLYTGQNPASAKPLAEEILAKL